MLGSQIVAAMILQQVAGTEESGEVRVQDQTTCLRSERGRS